MIVLNNQNNPDYLTGPIQSPSERSNSKGRKDEKFQYYFYSKIDL